MAGTTPIYGLPYPQSSDLVSAYPALGQDLAEDLDGLLASKWDNAPAQNTQTGTGASAYTFALADARRLIVANAGSAATYTIPPQTSVTWLANTVIQVTSIGAGVITFAGGAGVTVSNTAATLGQYQSAALIRTGSNDWTVLPFFGGVSYLTAADVSSTTGSPTISTYTSGGIGYTVYRFTGTGSIVTSKTGLCDVTVAGGGGGGCVVSWNRSLNAAGGGGSLQRQTLLLSNGTYTVTVGGGGNGASGGGGTTAANGAASSLGSVVKAGGGQAGISVGPPPSVGNPGWGGGGASGGTSQDAGSGSPLYSDGGGAGGTVYGSTQRDGRTDDITNSTVTYGVGGVGNSTTAGGANTGNGGSPNYAGGSGIVIVRVRT